MLLYPERGLVLNATAADVVRLCTGEVTVAAIVDQLATKYGSQPRETLEAEVLTFLTRLAERGLLANGDE
jgi:pyrroloquinoline quinone biosynthesis protein D